MSFSQFREPVKALSRAMCGGGGYVLDYLKSQFHKKAPTRSEVVRLPPVAWLGLAVLGYVVQWLIPGPRLLTEPFQNIGPSIFMLGLGLILLAGYKFATRRTNIHAFRDPEKLITDGIFAYTRNPIYLGLTIMLIGLAVYWNAVSALLAPAAFFAIANFYYAPQEEAAAERVFGVDYVAYRHRVRRWF